MTALAFSLLVPSQARAGVLSDFFANEASADFSFLEGIVIAENSQNIALLQSNVPLSQYSVSESKSKNDGINENVSINILDNALLPSTSPVFGGADTYDFSLLDENIIYVVRKGDTVDTVSKLFDVSVDTIYSANDLTKGSVLKEGDVLLVLPFSGVEHTVAKGETLQGITNKYKVDLEDILYANEIDSDTKLVVGEKLMIPGGGIISPAKSIASGSTKVPSYLNMPLTAGYFQNPLPGSRKTRGVKPGHKGVDMAMPVGTSIHAAASGVVIKAKNGCVLGVRSCGGGFGNYVVIQHPNGVRTLYAHMTRLGTTLGASVSKGDVIGYVGNTGRSRGAHLHFETIGTKNPF